MRLRPAFIAVTMTAVISCWIVVRAQQQTQPVPDRVSFQSLSLQPDEVVTIANDLTRRAERLKPIFEQVHPAEWIAKGAPEAYVSQWNSLSRQNAAIQTDMSLIAEHPEAMSDVMKALFRLHRFDADLQGLLAGVRRYQAPSLADSIESAAAGDQRNIEKLQQYSLDLANEKERQLDLEDREAQRCRTMLATQPQVRQSAVKKTNGNSK